MANAKNGESAISPSQLLHNSSLYLMIDLVNVLLVQLTLLEEIIADHGDDTSFLTSVDI